MPDVEASIEKFAQLPGRVAALIVTRSAFRILPAVNQILSPDVEIFFPSEDAILSVFRSLSAAWYYSTLGESNWNISSIYRNVINQANKFAGKALSVRDRVDGSQAVALNVIEAAARISTLCIPGMHQRKDVADAARSVLRAESFLTHEDLVSAFNIDVEAYFDIRDIDKNIWISTPKKFSDEALLLSEELCVRDVDWIAWIACYEERVSGRPCSPESERRRLEIEERHWVQGATVANPLVRMIEAQSSSEVRVAWLQRKLAQSRNGMCFELTDYNLIIEPNAAKSDLDACGDPILRQLHPEVCRKSRALQTELGRYSNKMGWTGAPIAAAEFYRHVNNNLEEIVGNLGLMYSRVVELGTFLEQDQLIATAENTLYEALDTETRRIFVDFFRTASPWLRRFPTIRDLDNEAGQFLSQMSFVESARHLIKSAVEKKIFNGDAESIVLGIVDSGLRGGGQSKKARSLMYHTAINVIKVGSFALAASAATLESAYSNKSPLFEKIADLIATEEKQITSILSDVPADLRFAVEAVFEKGTKS